MFLGKQQTQEAVANTLAEALQKLRQVGTLLSVILPWSRGEDTAKLTGIIRDCDTHSDKLLHILQDHVKELENTPAEEAK